MTVSSTSKQAYAEHVNSGQKLKQREAIMECIRNQRTEPTLIDKGGFTRRNIAEVLGFELGATAGRVNKLVKDGLLVEAGTTKCSVTNKTVGLVRLPGDVQLKLL